MSRKKEQFQPLEAGHVGFYLCGPTVYNDIHIGNARTFINFDVIRRYLIYKGFEVTFVSNLTDVDDKIINKANQEGCDPQALAAHYAQVFQEAMASVGVLPPDVQPRATQEIDTMIALIEELVAGGHAYEPAGSVYFSVRSDPDYGKLSHRDIDELQSGARVEVDSGKRDPLDFALWKAAKPGEPSWPSPWGPGRPGWHLECSAMSAKYLGLPFDIHAGGNDLIFPHHENEIAQSECASGHGFARYWLHSGMLTIDSEKMSKSEGNFLLLKDVLKVISAPALRLLMLQTHYRSPFDYAPARLDEAKAAWQRINEAVRNTAWRITAHNEESHPDPEVCAQIERTRDQFVQAMDDDFNTALALAGIYDLIGLMNSHESQDAAAVDCVRELLGVLGVEVKSEAEAEYPPEVCALCANLAGIQVDQPAAAMDALMDARAEARSRKDFGLSDRIRDALLELGYQIKDTAQGAQVVKL
jgi:cysteinyl-tRNA synthetase